MTLIAEVSAPIAPFPIRKETTIVEQPRPNWAAWGSGPNELIAQDEALAYLNGLIARCNADMPERRLPYAAGHDVPERSSIKEHRTAMTLVTDEVALRQTIDTFNQNADGEQLAYPKYYRRYIPTEETVVDPSSIWAEADETWYERRIEEASPAFAAQALKEVARRSRAAVPNHKTTTTSLVNGYRVPVVTSRARHAAGTRTNAKAEEPAIDPQLAELRQTYEQEHQERVDTEVIAEVRRGKRIRNCVRALGAALMTAGVICISEGANWSHFFQR